MLLKLAWFNLQIQGDEEKDHAQNAPLAPMARNPTKPSAEELNVWLLWSQYSQAMEILNIPMWAVGWVDHQGCGSIPWELGTYL